MEKKLFELKATPWREKDKPFRVFVSYDDVFMKIKFRARAKTTKGVVIHSSSKIFVDSLTERVKSMGVEVMLADRNGEPFNLVEEYIKSLAIRFKMRYDQYSKMEKPTRPYNGMKATVFVREGGKMREELDWF